MDDELRHSSTGGTSPTSRVRCRTGRQTSSRSGSRASETGSRSSHRRLAKYRNIQRDPRVAFSIGDDQNPYRAANLRGRIVEWRNDGAIWDDVIDPMAVKYMGEPFPFRPETTVLCLVEVESAKVRVLPFVHSPSQ